MKLHHYVADNNWNLGFCELTPEQFVTKGKLPNIKWMKHSYCDRAFADPFILSVNESSIQLLVEEISFSGGPGKITELSVNRETFELISCHDVLRKESHLSYPGRYFHNNKILVCPENGQSGQLFLYEYDISSHSLVNPILIVDESLADATIFETRGTFHLVASKKSDVLGDAYHYKADNIEGPYIQVSEKPISVGRSCSRPGGAYFLAENNLYRPAQDCSLRYGAGLCIKLVEVHGMEIKETPVFYLKPDSFRYNLGLHTINFHSGICVVDGYGYRYPILGRLYNSSVSNTLKQILKG